MPDLQPISSEKDILAEAARVVSPNVINPTIQPVAQPQPTAVSVSAANPVAVSAQPVQSTAPEDTPAPTPMSYRPPAAASQPAGSTISISYTPNSYTYALPATSYFLAWMYIISAVVIGGYLAYFLYILGQFSKYSSYSSSSSVSSATSQYFGSVILPLVLVIVACVVAFIFLRSNTKTSRYLALGVAGLLTAYEIYWATQLFTTSSSMYSTTSTWSMLWAYYSVFIIPFLPYLLLPIATIVYLVTSKAARAYNRNF